MPVATIASEKSICRSLIIIIKIIIISDGTILFSVCFYLLFCWLSSFVAKRICRTELFHFLLFVSCIGIIHREIKRSRLVSSVQSVEICGQFCGDWVEEQTRSHITSHRINAISSSIYTQYEQEHMAYNINISSTDRCQCRARRREKKKKTNSIGK